MREIETNQLPTSVTIAVDQILQIIRLSVSVGSYHGGRFGLTNYMATVAAGIVRELLTPKQVARALDVSESSIKRWCDKGLIATQYTAGGHRRIAMADLLEYLRANQGQLVYPAALGLPPTSGQTSRVVARARERLVDALVAGDEATCREIAFDLYLADHDLSVICDDLLAAAFHEIGDRWSCGDVEVYQERRGCEMAIHLLHELRENLPPVPADAPLAIGCALAGDPYRLGTAMAELVLRQAKWSAFSLGENLPFGTVSAALHEHVPCLFWLSCSHIADEAAFLNGYCQLYEEHASDIAFVVGGQALTEVIRRQIRYATHCDNMQHLQGFAQTLRTAIEKKSA